jgi:hypothetical protein
MENIIVKITAYNSKGQAVHEETHTYIKSVDFADLKQREKLICNEVIGAIRIHIDIAYPY